MKNLCLKISNFFVVSIFIVTSLEAAIPENKLLISNSEKKINYYLNKYKGQELILKLSSDVKLLPSLVKMSEDYKLSDSRRWVLIMAMSRLGGKEIVDVLDKIRSSKSSSWFVRSAVAKSLGIIRGKKALSVLYSMMDDNSLVVRTIVVDSIGDIGESTSMKYLVKQMNDKRNFHKGKSLWIRKHIIKAIAVTGKKRSVPVLISYVDDKDKKVAQISRHNLMVFVKESKTNWSKRNWIDWWRSAKKI